MGGGVFGEIFPVAAILQLIEDAIDDVSLSSLRVRPFFGSNISTRGFKNFPFWSWLLEYGITTSLNIINDIHPSKRCQMGSIEKRLQYRLSLAYNPKLIQRARSYAKTLNFG